MVEHYQKNMLYTTIDREKYQDFCAEVKETFGVENLIETIKMDGPSSLKGSSIIEKGDIKLLKHWLGEGTDLLKRQKKSLKLVQVFKATQDGYLNTDYWRCCEGMSNVFFFAKSTLGKRFGGFRTFKIDKSNSYKSDKHAFIFSLTYKHKCKQLNKNQTYAIYDTSDRMPTFGGGHDFTIYSPCHTTGSSYAKPYYTYEEPKNVKGAEGIGAKEFLAGAYNFKLEELEVYQMVHKDMIKKPKGTRKGKKK